MESNDIFETGKSLKKDGFNPQIFYKFIEKKSPFTIVNDGITLPFYERDDPKKLLDLEKKRGNGFRVNIGENLKAILESEKSNSYFTSGMEIPRLESLYSMDSKIKLTDKKALPFLKPIIYMDLMSLVTMILYKREELSIGFNESNVIYVESLSKVFSVVFFLRIGEWYMESLKGPHPKNFRFFSANYLAI